MAKLYRIRNWQDTYEVNRTRELKTVKWIPIPVNLSGDGYCRIMEDEVYGPSIFGAFIALVELAACCEPRGTLIRSSGDPHTSNSISRICRIDEGIIQKMISFCSESLKWIEIIELEIDCEKTARQCETTADAPVCNTCSVIPVLPVIPVLTAQPEPFENAKHAKRSKIPNNVAFEINGQKILYSFYQSILNACDGDREMAGRVFFRAKCRSKEPIKWISAGMMRKDGEKYALKSIREEDENPQAVREWIDTVVNHEEVLSDRG